jgi:hypothetical protein
MFKIQNISKRDIVLDDFKVILGPGKKIDLDKVATRTTISDSVKLRMAISQKRIEIVERDSEVEDLARDSENSPTHPQYFDQSSGADISSQIAHAVSSAIADQQGQNNVILEKIMEQLKSIADRPAQVVQGGSRATADSEDDMPEDIAAAIHAKAVKRMTKDVKGQIDTQATSTDAASINKNLDDLDDLDL